MGPSFHPNASILGKHTKLTKSAYKELVFWASLYTADASITLVVPRAVKYLWSDRSLARWGACLDGREITGNFPEYVQSLHIGCKELFAISMAATHFHHYLVGC